MPEKNTMKIVISTAVLLILAAVFITSIADQTAVNTQKTVVTDEAYNLTTIGCYQAGQVNSSQGDEDCNITVTYAPTSWNQEDCPLTSVVVENDTGTLTLTLDTDYSVTASTGTIRMLNTTSTNLTSMGDDVLITYTYCGDNYVSSSWGRDVLNVNVGLYAVAILIAAALVVYLLFGKKEDD